MLVEADVNRVIGIKHLLLNFRPKLSKLLGDQWSARKLGSGLRSPFGKSMAI